MDNLSIQDRKKAMSSVSSENTSIEKEVRSILWRQGFRYRVNVVDLPGKPDIANKTQKIAIFVHGCFWHGHDCKHGKNRPKTNKKYWNEKINRNRTRDEENIKKLKELGYCVIIVWECELRNIKEVERRLLDTFKQCNIY
ncbi:MAG: very short patch repair endonuclease [bacterium]